LKVPLSRCRRPRRGTATAELTWDLSTRIVTWRVTYLDMSGPVTMARFHLGARRNGPVVIRLT
jgi:hypothetical protein